MPETVDHAYEYARDVVGSLFDANYYVEAYQDIRRANVDPLGHYLGHGWREGRNPSRNFDTSYYLAENPDVRACNENPLVHFARIGAAEGRRPMRPVPPERIQIRNSRPPRERVADWLRPPSEAGPDSFDLGRCLEDFGVADAAGLVLSLSHDEYTVTAGGVQNCISDEAAMFPRMGVVYLHACPAQPLPVLSGELRTETFRLLLTMNGTRLGEVTHAKLAAELASLQGRFPCWLVVHHMLGHSPELITALARIVGADRTIVWTHDFFTLCPSWVLMRNDVAFCSAPGPASGACGICCYGEERKDHMQRMRSFFDAVAPAVLAPSILALDFWRERGNLHHSRASVMAPCRIVLGNHPGPETVGGDDRALHVAFIGSPNYFKGWHVFDELASRRRGDPRYRFYELSSRRHSGLPYMRHVEVNVGPKNRAGMVDAIAEAAIDVVVLWSMCMETFSFTAHEAVAAGAALVTRRGPGNIVPAISAVAPGQVCALEREEELFEKFASGRIRDLAAAENRRRGTLVFGGHTADYLRSSQQARGALANA